MNVSDIDRLVILRIRVHTWSVKEFSVQMNLALGWSVLESQLLWGKIELPVV